MLAHDIIIKPLLTEKSSSGVKAKRYAFFVHVDATKTQIKNAVETAFGVKVDRVNTVNVRGKLKRQGRTQGYTARAKKAYVTLRAGEKPIAFFETLS